MKRTFWLLSVISLYILTSCDVSAATIAPQVSATLPPPETELPITPTPKYSIGSQQTSLIDGMVMVYVPEGEFSMGSDTSPDEQPIHTVYLDAFWIDQTEVTNQMYEMCVNAGACTDPEIYLATQGPYCYWDDEFANYPINYITWEQADAYCLWAGRRLPTEAEWEKAARGPQGLTYPWGNNEPDGSLANSNLTVGKTTAVGSYPGGASPYGALDMAGNMMEWIADWYDENYYKSESEWINPQGPETGSYHVVRDGTWMSSASTIRSANRQYVPIVQDAVILDIGFRCAISDPIQP